MSYLLLQSLCRRSVAFCLFERLETASVGYICQSPVFGYTEDLDETHF